MVPMLVAVLLALTAVSSPLSAQNYRSLSAQRDLRLDGNDLDLVPIPQPHRLIVVAQNGTIAIGQPQDKAVRFYGVDGTLLGVLGRDGAGPGEFRSISLLGLLADTLWVYDARLERFTLIDRAMKPVRTLPGLRSTKAGTGPLAGVPGFPVAMPEGLFADGSALAWTSPGVNQELPAEYTRMTTYLRAASDGTVLSEITRVPFSGSISLRQEKIVSYAQHPFSALPLVDISPDALRLVHVTVGTEGRDQGTFTILVKSTVTNRSATRRHTYRPVPVPRAAGDSVMNATFELLKQRNPTFATYYRREARVPATYPPFISAMIGNDGTIWLEERALTADRHYLVFDSQGAAIGRVQLPANTKIAVVQRNTIWAVERDEYDVDSVVRYRITN